MYDYSVGGMRNCDSGIKEATLGPQFSEHDGFCWCLCGLATFPVKQLLHTCKDLEGSDNIQARQKNVSKETLPNRTRGYIQPPLLYLFKHLLDFLFLPGWVRCRRSNLLGRLFTTPTFFTPQRICVCYQQPRKFALIVP